MSFLTDLEQLHLKKVNLVDELKSICKEERALRKILKILEEKLEAHEPTRLSLPREPVEWSSSPERVRSLYSS